MRVAAVLFRKSYGWGPQSAAAYLEEHGETPPGMSIEEMARKVAAAGGSVPLRVVK